MNIEVSIRDNDGWVIIEETHKSVIHRIAQTFGFNEKNITVLFDDEHYFSYIGSLVEECFIMVNNHEYRIKFDYLNGNHTIQTW